MGDDDVQHLCLAMFANLPRIANRYIVCCFLNTERSKNQSCLSLKSQAASDQSIRYNLLPPTDNRSGGGGEDKDKQKTIGADAPNSLKDFEPPPIMYILTC